VAMSMSSARFAGRTRGVVSVFAMVAGYAPALAWSHEGTLQGHVHTSDLVTGWLHPFSGADHLLAMLALGIWSAQRRGGASLFLPAVFLLVLGLGGTLAMSGFELPGIELMTVLSVLAVGAFIAGGARFTDRFAVVVVGGFALYHGMAHGLELPGGVAPLPYLAGLMGASAVLHGAGFALASGLRRAAMPSATRLAGAGVAATGMLLLFA